MSKKQMLGTWVPRETYQRLQTLIDQEHLPGVTSIAGLVRVAVTDYLMPRGIELTDADLGVGQWGGVRPGSGRKPTKGGDHDP